MSSGRKSIIKSSKSKGDNLRKRLSFAPDPEVKRTKEDTRKQSRDATQLASSDTTLLANSSCKMATLGLYYDPKANHRVLRQHDTIPMNQNPRHDFLALQDFASFSRNITADVLIYGEKIYAEKLKTYLLEVHDKQDTRKGFHMGLHITCEEDFPEIVKAHFILFLLFKDTHKSMRNLFNIVRRCVEGTLSNKRIMVLSLSPAEGSFKSVVDLEQFRTLLSTHQLVHLTLMEQGRLDREEVNVILELIKKSVGYHRGTSLLSDFAMQVDLKSCFMDDVVLQDSTLNITGK